MALGKRKQMQQELLVATTSMPQSPGHPFYQKLNRQLFRCPSQKVYPTWDAARIQSEL